MSFDVFFQPHRYDGTTERRVNPFTKKKEDFPRNLPLSKAEVSAVRAVLEKHGARRDGQNYEFDSEDGANAEIYAKDLEGGCMFAIRGAGITPALATLLFEVMVAGNWVIGGSGEGDVLIAPNKTCLQGSSGGDEEIVVATSPEEVAVLLEGGFDAWQDYRDKVLGAGPGGAGS